LGSKVNKENLNESKKKGVFQEEVTLKFARILGISLYYLIGNSELEFDEHTLKRMEDISKMPSDDRSFILSAIDALVRTLKLDRLMQGKVSQEA
jgi:hypothetical protein